MMLKQYKYLIIMGFLLSLGSYFTYQHFAIGSLKKEVQEQEVKLEIKKDEIKNESFEVKWETIAQEHNKTEDKKDEIKKPIEHNEDDANFTDYFFFRAGVQPNSKVYKISLPQISDF